MSRIEEPPYATELREGRAEIRIYEPMIVAETLVAGERKAAVNTGFRLLAAYIFGANKPKAKIAMTAPVQQQSVQTIAMTAPVTQTASDGRWRVRFTMPREWTLETLPAPNDARVHLVEVPPLRVVALRFSGFVTENAIKARVEEIRNFADAHQLKIAEVPILSFYDPPWTLPFLRRNEVMFEII
ncbi:MAG: heme-binding protein [Alphaproteobacteria bacterium]